MVVYKGSPPVRKGLQNQIKWNPFQVLLTTYEYIIKDRPFLAKYKWVHMIIDEGHRMKNTNSKLSQTLTQYYSSRYRLILTGTPLQVSERSPRYLLRIGRHRLMTLAVAHRTTFQNSGLSSTSSSPRSSTRKSRSTSGSTLLSPTLVAKTRSI